MTGRDAGLFVFGKFRKMKITNQHIEFAKLSYEDELTDALIAERLGITERTVNNWNANSEIQKLIEQLGQRDINKAKRTLRRTAFKAADTLKNCLTCGEPETCRKAACDILQSTELKQEPGAISINIVDKKLEISETKE